MARASTLCVSILFGLLIGADLSAQTTTVSGRVVEAGTDRPIQGAVVTLVDSLGGTAGGTYTGATGEFRIDSPQPGNYELQITLLGYTALSRPLMIRQEDVDLATLELSVDPLIGDVIVVSASRRPEKLTQAPASISVVSQKKIEAEIALSPVDYVRDLPGLDVVQGGLTQNTVVARGFNNVFSGALTTLTDYRIASVPSLRYNAYYFIPAISADIERIEVVRGPGSALYGPNATSGVMHMLTHSPFASEGTWLSVAAGERGVLQGAARHSTLLSENLGLKISANYLRGTDWTFSELNGVNRDTAEIAARDEFLAANPDVDPDTVRIGMRDSILQKAGAEMRLDWITGEASRLVFSGGLTDAISTVDATGVGAAHAKDWLYWYGQVRFNLDDLFLQTYLNQSHAGDSYLLRSGDPLVDRSILWVTQAQHSSELPQSVRITYGADLFRTVPVTDSTITGSNEQDDDVTEVGGYLQAEAPIAGDLINLTAAARLDYHSRLDDPVFSPRAAAVIQPHQDHHLRLSWNRAYSAPTTNELFLDIVAEPSDPFDIRAAGVPVRGYSFRFGSNGEPLMRSFLATDDAEFLALDDIGAIWDGVREITAASIEDSAIAQMVRQIPAPPPGAISTELRILDPNDGTFKEFSGTVTDRTAVKPTTNSTLEIGYIGEFFDRLRVSVDLYRSNYRNFVGPLEVITPTLFFQRASLASYLTGVLTASGVPEQQAEIQAALFAGMLSGQAGSKSQIGLPLGNVTPVEATDPTAVMLTYRNYGNITIHGIDFSAQAIVGGGLLANLNVSWIDSTYFPNLDGIADLSLNAPGLKISGGIDYFRPGSPIGGGVDIRFVDSFRVRSGVYAGTVPAYTTVSGTVSWQVPWVSNLVLTLSAQNLLTFVQDLEEDAPALQSDSPFQQRHVEFIGMPPIGRLVLARLTYRL